MRIRLTTFDLRPLTTIVDIVQDKAPHRLSGGAVFDDAASARRISRGPSLAADGEAASAGSVDVTAAVPAVTAAPVPDGAKESVKRPRRRSNLGSARRRVSAVGSRLGGARRISRERGLR